MIIANQSVANLAPPSIAALGLTAPRGPGSCSRLQFHQSPVTAYIGNTTLQTIGPGNPESNAMQQPQ